MDQRDLLQLLAGIIALSAYLPLARGILRNTARQSFAAFFLWAMLDTIAMFTTWLQGGNFWLALGNVVGSSAIAMLVISKRQVSWSRVESATSVLVGICLVVWYIGGERAGIIASSLAVVIASLPQMVETYKIPEDTPQISYLIFLTGNILSLAAGKAWTIEERFYPACSVFLCAVIVLLSMGKRRYPVN